MSFDARKPLDTFHEIALGSSAVASQLQSSVKRFVQALSIPDRLIQLHPGTVGHSGAAAAIAPAVVTMCISAFEGFVEDIAGNAMYTLGYSYTQIAKTVGNWTNPDIEMWGNELRKHFSLDLSLGYSVRTTRGTQAGNWSARTFSYPDSVRLGSAWMNVRHALSHGEVCGRGAERWPNPRRGEPVSTVLRRNANDASKHHLELPGARGCGALYTYSAVQGANLLAGLLHQSIVWTGVPEFEPVG